MALIPKSQREQWRAELEAATPGPWGVYQDTPFDPVMVNAPTRGICRLDGWEHRPDEREQDAHLIASAPTAISALLAENCELRRMVREACGIAEVIRDAHEPDSDGYQDDEIVQRATREFGMGRIAELAREVGDE